MHLDGALASSGRFTGEGRRAPSGIDMKDTASIQRERGLEDTVIIPWHWATSNPVEAPNSGSRRAGRRRRRREAMLKAHEHILRRVQLLAVFSCSRRCVEARVWFSLVRLAECTCKATDRQTYASCDGHLMGSTPASPFSGTLVQLGYARQRFCTSRRAWTSR